MEVGRRDPFVIRAKKQDEAPVDCRRSHLEIAENRTEDACVAKQNSRIAVAKRIDVAAKQTGLRVIDRPDLLTEFSVACELQETLESEWGVPSGIVIDGDVPERAGGL